MLVLNSKTVYLFSSFYFKSVFRIRRRLFIRILPIYIFQEYNKFIHLYSSSSTGICLFLDWYTTKRKKGKIFTIFFLIYIYKSIWFLLFSFFYFFFCHITFHKVNIIFLLWKLSSDSYHVLSVCLLYCLFIEKMFSSICKQIICFQLSFVF